MRILWLRPSRGDNISVRRERIAEKLEARGFDIVIKDASGTDLFSAMWTAVRGDFDVIAGNVRIGLYAGFPLARVLRKPFLGDVSDPLSDIDHLTAPLFAACRWYEWQVLSRADATVFVYKSSYEEALDRGIDDAANLPNAVDYEQFADPSPSVIGTAGDILSSYGVDFDNPIAIYLGVFSDHYCLPAILEAAARTPEWEFVLIGEGPLTDEVAAAAKEYENVYYPGSFEYRLMPGFLSYADVGFCFKDAEQPLKLKEYGAAGIPAIVRPGELNKYYSDDELLFVDPDPDAVSQLLTGLASEESRLETYGRALEARATEYSWRDIADEYERLFERIANSSSRSDHG